MSAGENKFIIQLIRKRLAILSHLMKKKRARTKSENLGSRLKKAVKSVFKKSGPEKKNNLPSKSLTDPAKPVKKNGSKAPKASSAGSLSRNRMYVTVKGKSKTGGQTVDAPHDLPFSYNKTELVLLVRDPEWAYAYWDFSSETWNWIQSLFKSKPGAVPKLRVHNLSAGNYFDIDIHLEGKNWYICLGLDNTEFQAELGLLDHDGRFHVIAKSNKIKTPRSKPSEIIDPNWIPEHFDELYRLSGGGRFGVSSLLSPALKKPSS